MTGSRLRRISVQFQFDRLRGKHEKLSTTVPFRFAKRYCLPLLLLFSMPLLLHAQQPAPLKLIESIPLPGLKEGDFDHFAVDLDGHRLFLTAEANALVEVFDAQTNKLIRTV